jgi:hypothetical protein
MQRGGMKFRVTPVSGLYSKMFIRVSTFPRPLLWR